jgi:hypothetical protein
MYESNICEVISFPGQPPGIWLKYALGFAQGGHDHDGFDLYINCVLVCLLLD